MTRQFDERIEIVAPRTETRYSGKCHIEDDLELLASTSVDDDGCVDVNFPVVNKLDKSERDDEDGRKEGDCNPPRQ